MAKTVKFKNPDSRMIVAGFGEIRPDNLTYEKYEYLLKLSPAHADQFIVTEDEVKIKSVKHEPDSKA
jgi:hypothetical protein